MTSFWRRLLRAGSVSISVGGRRSHASYEDRREPEHDDLVLPTAMACCFRQPRYAKGERNRLKAP